MKKIDYYLKLPYSIELIPDRNEGGYVAIYPDLPGCISQGETIEETIKNAEDAKREWIKSAIKDGYQINEPSNPEDYSGQFKLRMPKSLHRDLAKNAKREGISMNQYCLYLLAQNNAVWSRSHI